MQDTIDYKNCKVIFYDENSGKPIAETIVQDYDKKTLTIIVDSKFIDFSPYEYLSVLILHTSGIYEFRGTVRKARLLGLREISLFKGKVKENRATTRFILNTSARIENLVISNRTVALRNALDVVIINISTEGALIKGRMGIFNIGTAFQLKLFISNSETMINAFVVRINNVDGETAKYGCKFNYIYPGNSEV